MTAQRLYDLSNLDEMLGGDKDAKLQMIKIFLQATPESLSEMNKCFGKNDLEGISKLAHKLKSSIDIFCIMDIKQDIRRLENITRDQVNTDEVPDLIEKINTILHETFLQVASYKEELAQEIIGS
ncbi:MAG: Hpt domain-containing protein [Bacteroidales bacterium]|nr:Hpt domain-containing protein [Bacteroidales bacterium]